MSKVGRNSWVAYSQPQIIGETSGWRETVKARHQNDQLEKQFARRRKAWKLQPPSNMTLAINGLVLSVPAEAGRYALMKRIALIIERDIKIDMILEGSTEAVIEAMGLSSVI